MVAYDRCMLHRVTFQPRGRFTEVPAGTRLLDAVQGAGLPVARGCAGDALCGRCGLKVLRGEETLSPEGPEEAKAKRRNRIPHELRLSCCARVRGDLEVMAPYW